MCANFHHLTGHYHLPRRHRERIRGATTCDSNKAAVWTFTINPTLKRRELSRTCGHRTTDGQSRTAHLFVSSRWLRYSSAATAFHATDVPAIVHATTPIRRAPAASRCSNHPNSMTTYGRGRGRISPQSSPKRPCAPAHGLRIRRLRVALHQSAQVAVQENSKFSGLHAPANPFL
jgi:hypothetical protein